VCKVACPSGARVTTPTPLESRGWQRRSRGASTSYPRVRIGPTQPREVRWQRRIQSCALIPDCYELRWRGSELRGFGDDLWKLGLLRYSTCGATVLWVLFTPRVVAAARLEGRKERRAAELRPRLTREKGFPSNLLLD
jgi:hypothetical protein